MVALFSSCKRLQRPISNMVHCRTNTGFIFTWLLHSKSHSFLFAIILNEMEKAWSQWVTKVPGTANGGWRFADLQIYSFYKLKVFLGPNRQSNIMTLHKTTPKMISPNVVMHFCLRGHEGVFPGPNVLHLNYVAFHSVTCAAFNRHHYIWRSV